MPKTIGYIRLSREDAGSASIENQKQALLEYDPKMKIFIDKGVSGYGNLDDPKSAWNSKLLPELAKDRSARVCVYSFDRLGRAKGAVLHTVEQLIRGGGTLYDVREDRLYDDDENFSQAIELVFSSLSNEAYRVDITKKSKRAITVLNDAGVKTHRPPTLTENKIAQIKDLHARGLGYKAIGRVVTTTRVKDGKELNIVPRVIKKVIEGNYISRERFDRDNQTARNNLLNKRSE